MGEVAEIEVGKWAQWLTYFEPQMIGPHPRGGHGPPGHTMLRELGGGPRGIAFSIPPNTLVNKPEAFGRALQRQEPQRIAARLGGCSAAYAHRATRDGD